MEKKVALTPYHFKDEVKLSLFNDKNGNLKRTPLSLLVKVDDLLKDFDASTFKEAIESLEVVYVKRPKLTALLKVHANSIVLNQVSEEWAQVFIDFNEIWEES
ncbi:hypothetical protein [Alistipes sp. ZOR0009]|uniref:hypothetical protein n=1 Tax=Alistipes sp. ZOR0009 TaxID=1339253 RepID=UPI000648B45F|nr:hypothetical protein [Alistipes sp. ZOR0009]